MTQRFISPGVFTQENDLSFLPQGIAQIGAAFIGPTLKGTAFRPVIVTSQNDFTAQFGGLSTDFYTPYAVQNYLKKAERATVVRVLGLAGYDNAVVKTLQVTISGSGGEYTVGYLHPSRLGVTLPTGSIGTASSPTQFSLTISGSGTGTATFNSMSIDPTNANYFVKVLGTSPLTSRDAYVYASFPRAAEFISGALAGSGSVKVYNSTTTSAELMLSGSVYGTYANARTPMIHSQQIGSVKYDLFQFFTLSDGNAANDDVKISIVNIRPDPQGTSYGMFGVVVRDINDTDAKVNVLEQFDNLNLDPSSANYIGRRIGTSRTVIDANGSVYLEGEYPNNSKYVYVSITSAIDSVPSSALPYGFAALATPINATNVPGPSYITTRYYTPAGATTAVANNNVYYGYDFNDETGLSYLAPTPSGSINSALSTLRVGFQPSGSNEVPLGGADGGFDLLTILSSQDQSDLSASSAVTLRKFTVPFQGGFDGQNPAGNRYTGASIVSTNTQGFDLSDSSKDGAKAYTQAIQTLSDPDAWDINMLIMPGVIYSQHPYVAQQGINLSETRGDNFFIMDADILGATVSSMVNSITALDSNYTGVYHPWVKIFDADNNKNVWVPPSVVMAGVFANNDAVAAEWYAPAGLNRGGIDIALQVRTRLAQSDRDTLYDGRINPIAQFPAQGIVVWGQKTLQQDASALDRINVRRLLIAVKKYIASVSRYLVFEPNVDSTRQKFLSTVNPYLASVQERNGLYAFKVVMDSTNNTPDIIDRNILVGSLFLQPAKAAEGIMLSFNILPTGAAFSE